MSTLNIDNIADVAGTGAPDFAAMPSVAGDLLVESGSNTDGEWVRWADGTQFAFHIVGVGPGSAVIQAPPPVPFSSTAKVTANESDTNSNRYMSSNYDVPTNRVVIHAYKPDGTDADGFNAGYQATGRWKIN